MFQQSNQDNTSNVKNMMINSRASFNLVIFMTGGISDSKISAGVGCRGYHILTNSPKIFNFKKIFFSQKNPHKINCVDSHILKLHLTQGTLPLL